VNAVVDKTSSYPRLFLAGLTSPGWRLGHTARQPADVVLKHFVLSLQVAVTLAHELDRFGDLEEGELRFASGTTFHVSIQMVGPQIARQRTTYLFIFARISCSIASVSVLFRRGLMARASSGGYSLGSVSLVVSRSRGTMMVPELLRLGSAGRFKRRVLPRPRSPLPRSEPEEPDDRPLLSLSGECSLLRRSLASS
jgi:hypothetical protein